MQSEDLKARLLKVESASPDFIGRNDGGCHTCFYRSPDGPEAADRITALEAENARLRAGAELALEVAESWIHGQLGGTRMLEDALAELDPARAAIAHPKSGEQ